MEQLLGFFLTLAVGCAGFFLFRLFRVPTPALLGAMVATGALSAFGLYPAFPVWALSLAANAMIGVMVGKHMDRNILRRAKTLFLPVMIQVVGILVLSLACGGAFYHMLGPGNISLATALLSATAGGIAEMLIFGAEANADVAVIALVQLFRVVVFNGLMPYFALFGKRGVGETASLPKNGTAPLPVFSPYDYIFLAISAVGGSIFCLWAGVPSGGMLGAMAGSGLFAICRNRRYLFGRKLEQAAQIGLGAAMGARMTPEICGQLGALLLPALAVTGVMLAGCVLLAFAIHKITKWEMTFCLICAAPAGLSQVAVIAEENGQDSFTATVFHSFRLIVIVSLYPLIIMRFI